jgi:hypothetical protein
MIPFTTGSEATSEDQSKSLSPIAFSPFNDQSVAPLKVLGQLYEIAQNSY